MRRYLLRLIFSPKSLALIAVVAIAAMVTTAQLIRLREENEFTEVASQALLVVAQGETKGMQSIVSEGGLTIADYSRCYAPEERPPESKLLPQERPTVRTDESGRYWVREKHFTLRQVIDDPVSLAPALNNFASMMDSQGVYSPQYDLNTMSFERRLGATVWGKVCSGRYWYLCFEREEGNWRLTTLELIDH